jgi:hypothetical protein
MDTTSSWTYGSVERNSNGSANNRINWVDGLGESWVASEFHELTGASGTTCHTTIQLSAGTISATVSYNSVGAMTLISAGSIPPSAGARYVQAREAADSTATFFGDAGTGYYLFCAELDM